jgi:hypothetical protein
MTSTKPAKTRVFMFFELLAAPENDAGLGGLPGQAKERRRRDSAAQGWLTVRDVYDRAMIVANSRLDVPSANSDLTSRSSDTVG